MQIRFGLNVQIDKQQCTATRTPGEEVEKVWGHTGPGAGSGHRHRSGLGEGRTLKRGEIFFKVSFFQYKLFSGTDLKTPQRDAPSPAEFGEPMRSFCSRYKWTISGRGEGWGEKKKMLVYHSVLIQGSPVVITSATRQGGSVNFIATVLNGLPTPHNWIGLVFFFWKSGKRFMHNVIASRGFKTAPCHGTHLPSVKPFKMD